MKRKITAAAMIMMLVFSTMAMTGCGRNDDAGDLSQTQNHSDDNMLNDDNRDGMNDNQMEDNRDGLTGDLRDDADDLGDDIRDGAEDVKDDVEDVLDGNNDRSIDRNDDTNINGSIER